MLGPKRVLVEVADAIRDGRPIKLMSALAKLEKLAPGDPKVSELKAHIYVKLDDLDRALNAARTAYEDSGRAEYFAGFFASTLMLSPFRQEGIDIFEGLIRDGTKVSTNYLALSEYYINNGLAREALRVLASAESNFATAGLLPVFAVHRAVAELLSGDVEKAKGTSLGALSLLTSKSYQRFADVPASMVSSINIERLPSRWIEALAKTIVSWIKDETTGIEPRIAEIWSLELMQSLPLDDEIVSDDEANAIRLGTEALRRGEVHSLDDMEKEFGLL